MLFATLLALVGSSLAHTPQDGMDPDDRRVVYRPPPAALVVADTYSGVVGQLREKAASAEVALGLSKIVDLHRATIDLATLATALPAKATALTAQQQKTVADKTLDLAQQAERVKAAADAGDVASAQAAIVPVKADIDALAALVPPAPW